MTDTPRDPRLLWVDVETTGLTDDAAGGLYNNGLLLEVGLTLTSPDLDPIDSTDVVISYPGSVVEDVRAVIRPVVEAMHDKSGLWWKVYESRKPLHTAESELLGWAINKHGIKPRTLPMCGSSVHTDRQWLAGRMPSLEALFHYRIVDVSSIKELGWRWFGDDVARPAREPRQEHRALPDILDTLSELRHYRAALFR